LTARVNNPEMTKGQDQKAVVIGAGMGGLAAAIRLAAAGLSVTLIEAADGPGGKMRSVPSAAGPVDCGPTVLTMRAVFDDLFALAGQRLEDHLTLLPQPILARHWWRDGSQLDLFADPARTTAAIAAFGGAQAEADFRRFDAMAAGLHQAFEGPVMQAAQPDLAGILRNTLAAPRLWSALLPGLSLERRLALSFRDPRLRQLFGRYATYVGGAPNLSPAVLALIWRAEAQGVWAVKGGMRHLAAALATLAEELGVRLIYGQGVKAISRQKGRVTSVALTDGRALPCGQVVFNGDPRALETGLLGQAAQEAVPTSATTPRSLSAWVWAFAAKVSGPELVHHNVFFGPDPRLEFGPIAKGQMPTAPTLYICAQDRASGQTPDGPERFEIIMNGPADRPQDAGERDQCRRRTFQILASFGLEFHPVPEAQALTTPAQFATRFPGSQGAIYGRSPHGSFATFQRPGARTRLPGLYLAGGGAHPGAGVPMAALSGKHAAEAILSDLASTSVSGRTVMRGGMSTGSPTMEQKRSP
jgi:1-hydroxycarotenoid 3,4-desaturase